MRSRFSGSLTLLGTWALTAAASGSWICTMQVSYFGFQRICILVDPPGRIGVPLKEICGCGVIKKPGSASGDRECSLKFKATWINILLQSVRPFFEIVELKEALRLFRCLRRLMILGPASF